MEIAIPAKMEPGVTYLLRETFETPWDWRLWLSLHTADPGDTGNQATHEADYEGYERVPIGKGEAGWVLFGRTSVNRYTIRFPEVQRRYKPPLTHIGIGFFPVEPGKLLHAGPLDKPVDCRKHVQPSIAPGSLAISA
jgi:hypothetical protein